MSELLHKCMTKATTAEGDQRKVGASWVISRRGTLKLFEDHLECGNWQVDFSNITGAVLFTCRSPVLRIPGYILTVDTEDTTYHFGLNGWGSFWKGDLPFEAKRESGKLAFTWFSIVVRAIVIGYIAYMAWQWLTS